MATNIGPGETVAEFYLKPDMAMDTVTLLLGSPQRVIDGNWTTTLEPLER